MAPAHPLEIQEIADLVASYLESEDLARCIGVSRSWRDAFLLHRWKKVSVDDSDGTHPFGPRQEAIFNRRHSIQDLSLFNTTNEYTKYDYPSLRRLKINVYGRVNGNDPFFMDLTTKAPMLVDLKLVYVTTPPGFWDTLSTHPHIRHLHLVSLYVRVHDSAGLWKTFMKLESLQMDFTKMERGDHPKNVVLDRLRKLRLNGTWLEGDSIDMDVMVQSPMLESLAMKFLICHGHEGHNRRILNGDWPHLKTLYVDGCVMESQLNFIFKRVENGPVNIVNVEPYHSGFSAQASRTFDSRFSALVDVDFCNSMIMGSIIPDLLCLCPRLERLLTRKVLARNVAERGPWMCQHLRELRIQFLFGESEQDLRQLIFERLSTLVLLEQLTLDYSSLSDYDMLECRLDCGLERLAFLQQLNSFWLYTPNNDPWYPNLGMEDVTWMVENWRELEKVKGQLNQDRELTAQLRSVFESHGISVERY